MTLDDLIASVDAEESEARLKAVAAIKAYAVARDNEQMDKAAKDTAGNVLRDYFRTHPDETELADTEWGLRSWMQNGGRTNVYDHPNAIKAANPRLYARMEELGLFRLDDAAVQQALKEGTLTHGDLAGYVHAGERSQSLQVRSIRR